MSSQTEPTNACL